MTNEKGGKPLYDGRAKFSDLLVEKVKSITQKNELHMVNDAYKEMIDYFHLTAPHIKDITKQEIIKELNTTSRKINNLNMFGLDSADYLQSRFDIIFGKVISATTQLLSPTADEDDDDDDY